MEDTPRTMVECSVEDGVACITLQHPFKPNPLSLAMQKQILSALQQMEAHPGARVLLVQARGRAFCVGADLAEMQEAAAIEPSLGRWTGGWMARWLNPIALALHESRLPVLCAVQGAAAGAGAGLALAGDLLVMASSSFLLFPFVPRLGLIPDMGCSWHLPRKVGASRALGITLLGDHITASEAVRMGLAWSVADDEGFEASARALARRLAALPPGAAREARMAISRAGAYDLSAQLDYERERQVMLVDAPPFAEGVSAFLEKREPDFWRDSPAHRA